MLDRSKYKHELHNNLQKAVLQKNVANLNSHDWSSVAAHQARAVGNYDSVWLSATFIDR